MEVVEAVGSDRGDLREKKSQRAAAFSILLSSPFLSLHHGGIIVLAYSYSYS